MASDHIGMLLGGRTRFTQAYESAAHESAALTIGPLPYGRAPSVFISYLHDNDEHKDDVLRLAAFLRNRGSTPSSIAGSWAVSIHGGPVVIMRWWGARGCR
jgi:hypothetical protein